MGVDDAGLIQIDRRALPDIQTAVLHPGDERVERERRPGERGPVLPKALRCGPATAIQRSGGP